VIDPDDRSGETTFVESVTRTLDETTVNANVRARLDAARRAAVAELEAGVLQVPSRWMPLAAAAVTVLAVGLAVILSDDATLPAFDDDGAFVVAQDRELLEEMEFLAWLDDMDLDHAS
jgi:hypothetical protein